MLKKVFWMATYLVILVRYTDPQYCASSADAALREYNKRLTQDDSHLLGD